MKLQGLLPFLPALSTAFPTILSRGDDVLPPSVQIRGVTYGGSGCPQGSLQAGVAQNGTVFGLIFDGFVASMGPGIDYSESLKNCQLNFDVLYSPGFQYQVYSTEYYGWADLDAGVTGTLQTTYYFSGQTAQDVTSTKIAGPVDKAYIEEQDRAIVAWSTCGSEAMLNINTQLHVDGTGSGSLSVDKESAKFTQLLYVDWQAC